MTNIDNEKTRVFYGKIDFYSMTGKVMETIYYENREEFYQEIKDSYEIGRPINPTVLSKNKCFENDFDEEDEEMEID
ncbi:hypothetical protein [Clostridium kluyveri]|uniref:hypothetical protein n=1 Tax=Clostridium kluyveri TaxID=1534 RepID=UPI002245B54C|nr:hypothetical protein [Clostridium kluyveri]UZQ48871.1 hypothetical protein OP486_12860 [Clostridium kluyveri]